MHRLHIYAFDVKHPDDIQKKQQGENEVNETLPNMIWILDSVESCCKCDDDDNEKNCSVVFMSTAWWLLCGLVHW